MTTARLPGTAWVTVESPWRRQPGVCMLPARPSLHTTTPTSPFSSLPWRNALPPPHHTLSNSIPFPSPPPADCPPSKRTHLSSIPHSVPMRAEIALRIVNKTQRYAYQLALHPPHQLHRKQPQPSARAHHRPPSGSSRGLGPEHDEGLPVQPPAAGM